MPDDRIKRVELLKSTFKKLATDACLKQTSPGTLTLNAWNKKNHSANLTYSGGSKLGEGSFGIAYDAVSRGDHAVIKIAAITEGNIFEGAIAVYLTKAVTKKECPNILCTGGFFTCRKTPFPMQSLPVPSQIQDAVTKKGYVLSVMEFADAGTLRGLLKTGRPPAAPLSNELYVSLMMQCLLALRTIHSAGYTHSDAHHGNFLLRKTAPGGCWEYKLKHHMRGEPKFKQRFYVDNLGYQVLMSDFGWVTKYHSDSQIFTGANGDFEYTGARLDVRFLFREMDGISSKARMVANTMLDLSNNISGWVPGVPTTFFIDHMIASFEKLANDELYAVPKCEFVINGSPYTCKLSDPKIEPPPK